MTSLRELFDDAAAEAPPSRMSGAEVSPGPRVAAVGEHTEEVLKEVGMSDEGVASAAAK